MTIKTSPENNNPSHLQNNDARDQTSKEKFSAASKADRTKQKVSPDGEAPANNESDSTINQGIPEHETTEINPSAQSSRNSAHPKKNPDHDTVAPDDSNPNAFLHHRIDLLTKNLEEEKKRAISYLANLENTRRRLEKEKQDALRFGASNFIRDMLVVADNLSLALAAANVKNASATQDTWKGVEMTERELQSVLTRHGITTIQPNVGDPFDYDIHLAIGHAISPSVPEGSIASVVQSGYRLHERLLRPASVMVAKHEANDPGTNAPHQNGQFDDPHRPIDKKI